MIGRDADDGVFYEWMFFDIEWLCVCIGDAKRFASLSLEVRSPKTSFA